MADTTSIPTRANGDKILASWFNTIKTFLSNFESYSNVTTDTIDNNVSVAEEIVGMTLDAASYTSAVYEMELYRSTDSVDAFANGKVYLQRVAGAWRIDTGGWSGDADATPGGGGITFSVTESGGIAQVKYVTSNIAGTSYVGNIKITRIVFDV